MRGEYFDVVVIVSGSAVSNGVVVVVEGNMTTSEGYAEIVGADVECEWWWSVSSGGCVIMCMDKLAEE